MTWKTVTLTIVLATIFGFGCGADTQENAAESSETSAQLVVRIQASPDYSGWLYSYGLEWIECAPATTWSLPSIISSAYASHPITYTEVGQWQWHQRILVGDAQELVFQGPINNTRYCGVHWLFAHGGVTVNGELSSFQITTNQEVIANSHHAWALQVEFEKPICAQGDPQSINLELQIQQWLQSTLIHDSPTQNARSATLSLVDYTSIEGSPCPGPI